MTRDFDEELAILEERVKDAVFILRDCQYGIEDLKARLTAAYPGYQPAYTDTKKNESPRSQRSTSVTNARMPLTSPDR